MYKINMSELSVSVEHLRVSEQRYPGETKSGARVKDIATNTESKIWGSGLGN